MDPHSPGPADRAKPAGAALVHGAPRRLAYNKDRYSFLLRITKTVDLLGGGCGGVGFRFCLFVFFLFFFFHNAVQVAASDLKSEACGSVIQPKHLFLQHILMKAICFFPPCSSGGSFRLEV